MRLSASFIVNYTDTNHFAYYNQWKMRAGDPTTLYFQLTDLDQADIRYMAGIGSQNQPYSVVVTCPSIDNTKILSFTAIQADPSDSSIWKIVIAPTQIPQSGNVIFSVTEGNSTRTFQKMNGLQVILVGAEGSC